MKVIMKNLTLSAKLLLVIVFLCYMQAVSAFNDMTGNYTVTVQCKGTGEGKVYSQGSWNMWDNKAQNDANKKYSGTATNEVTLSGNNSVTLTISTGSKSVYGWNNPSVEFGEVTLTASYFPGSSFDGWESSYGEVKDGTLCLPGGSQITTTRDQSSTPELNNNHQIVIYAKFTAKTYHFRSPTIRAVYQGENGIETGGGTVALVRDGGTNSRPTDESGEWQQKITGSLISAQGNGVYDGIVYEYSYHAKPNDGYVFIGWHKIDDDKLTQLSAEQDYLPAEGTTATSTNENSPTVGPVWVALFKESTTYYHTGVSVAIAGYEDERAEKGWVFADDDPQGTVDAVENANAWVESLHDDTVYSQVDDIDYTYTYYAKPEANYAFKGWATTPFGEATYFDNPTFNTFTITDDYTSEGSAYPTPTLYAVFEAFFYRCPPVAVADNSRGGGKVYVSLEQASVEDCTEEELSAGEELQQEAATENLHTYTVYYYAKKTDGAEFVGWSTTPDGLNIIQNSVGKTEYSTTYESQAKSKNAPHVAPPLYAVFRHDFDIRQQDRMIVYDDEEGNKSINDAKVLIDFQKGNTLTATLSGADASYFTLSNRSGSKKGNSITFDATQGLIELVVAYTGDLAQAVGKKAEITLSSIYGDYADGVTRKVTITVEQAPVITFLPTDGKGEYTVKMTNGSGINYEMGADVKENLKVQITHESMSNLEMHLTTDVAEDDYRFFGWQMIDGETSTYLSYDDLVNYQFTKSVSVRAEFIHNSAATYSIEGDDTNTPYHDFTLVMKEAGELAESMGVSQTVVLNDSWKGTPIKEGVLPKGNYTIPKGVNLLIPGDKEHTYRTNLTRDGGDFLNQDKLTSSEHIRWIVEEGTNITVEENANVLVYSRIITCGNTDNGRPYQYGHIELKENCKLNFKSGSNLYVYGYITGPLTSEVTMNSGSTVKEVFQVKDWRGGSATSAIVFLGGRYKVFLIGQYYVQNVEVPLVIRNGASEILEAGISDLADMDVDFIVSNTTAALFKMGDGVWIKKYYDPYTDRLSIIASKDENATGKLDLASIAIDAGIATVSSKDYVLPIPNNFDVKVQGNLEASFSNDYAFMPGSTLTIEKGSIVMKAKGRLFAYDDIYKTVEGKGYYGADNVQFATLSHRPGGFKYKRSDADLVDAKFVIDGELICDGGEIYTTNSTTQTTNHANITSNGGGKVTFGSLSGYDEKVYQIYQDGKSPQYKEVPVSPARLRQGNGSYVVPDPSKTYTYVDNKWTADASTTPNPNVPAVVDYVPRFNVSEVSEVSTYVGKSIKITVTATANNSNIPTEDWANASKMVWNYELIGTDANQFSISGDEGAGSINFTPTSAGLKKATLRITATYTRNVNAANTAAKYTYSKDVILTGNATYLQANTLAFADLSSLYEGQEDASELFAEGANNSQPITISVAPEGVVTVSGNTAAATITPNAVGEVTITATQPADLTNNIAGTTITKKVKVNERVVWNWDVLYFGTVNQKPITVLDGSTDWTLTKTTDAKNIINYDQTNKTATIADLIAGKYEDIIFTFSQEGYEDIEFESHVIVNPQHLRVDVNNDIVYRAVTLSANDQVQFIAEGSVVKFISTEQSISQWKMGFIGVPDKLSFKPTGGNAWQIEESQNGVNWTTSMPWKTLPSDVTFEMSLLPSTRYLRISYGAGSSTLGGLKDLYITELADVKTDVEKLYMPVESDGNGGYKSVAKEVVFTYANTGKLSITTSNTDIFKVKESGTSGDPTEGVAVGATTEDNPFGIIGVDVVSMATEETSGYIYVYEGSNLVLQIPIQTYLFPQDLPIKLATDKPDGGGRYYYVTTHTHNVEWNGEDGVRTITMNNAVSDAAPYVTFAFNGNPTFISFDYTTAKGVWEIEESVDGKSWTTTTPAANDVMADGTLKRTLKSTSKQVRVIYESAYAERVDVTNLVIVGNASVVVDPALLEMDYNVPAELTVSAINLSSMKLTIDKSNFTLTHGSSNGTYVSEPLTLSGDKYPEILGENKMGDVKIYVKWTGTSAVEYGTLTITNPNDNDKVLATVELVGRKSTITEGELGIWTGVADGYNLIDDDDFEGKDKRKVVIDAAFSSEGAPLFDYVVVYGETTTTDGNKDITRPNTMLGSNAKTSCYIYKKTKNANDDNYTYKSHKVINNVNSAEKAWPGFISPDVDGDGTSVSMYITGFAPYASTGYTKEDEGVWYFQANEGENIDIYLEDCYIYSRAKTDDGHFFEDRQDGYAFTEPFVRGSGAVLVFACNSNTATSINNPMNVTIHTLGSNLLKSHYGCFLQSVAGRAYQASPPVQIRMINDTYLTASKTILNFTDEWRASKDDRTGKRTNGFLSLQKQVNNAPSIDMGNDKTEVNFNGGQIELQNAQIVSTNYVSSMAICHRVGTFAGIPLAKCGIGADGTGGTVNFNDGTTTVKEMWVSPNYFESYLCDKDEKGNYIKNAKGEYLTTCLRTPANTFIKGGSHCMMRACTDPTRSGGAPKDAAGNLLGLYKYPQNPETGHKGGWIAGENGNELVKPTNVPDGYSVNSVTPNPGVNGTIDAIPCTDGCDDYLNFWFNSTDEPSVQPEIEKAISFWKTCMTEISAEYGGYGGSVGGSTEVLMSDDDQMEIVKNLMYCKIDENIQAVIASEGYAAPVKNPAPSGEDYLVVPPSEVGDETQNYITNAKPFQVEGKVYYITTATADNWMTFTAPFDVENVYIMETYSEDELVDYSLTFNPENNNPRQETMTMQAEQNAHFAAFFAVTVALGQQKDFETIYREYIEWGRITDKKAGLYESGIYNLRGKYKLIPYIPGSATNGWANANFYLNHNNGNWIWGPLKDENGEYVVDKDDNSVYGFDTKWNNLTQDDIKDGILLTKGETYSMLFPYCVGCDEDLDSRTEWDYWSGKFLIFESTDGPHEINGSDYVDATKPTSGKWVFDPKYGENEVVVAGNSTFAQMQYNSSSSTLGLPLYVYDNTLNGEFFEVSSGYKEIEPTTAFLYGYVPTKQGMPAHIITRMGKIDYGSDDNNDDGGIITDNHVPTINGGSDLFVTSVAEGINIAVGEPQHVGVFSATGQLIYSGWVETSVDVNLVVDGVYVVVGENTSLKVLY